MEELENFRSPGLLIVLLLITCAILTALYYHLSGRELASVGFLTSFAVVFFVSAAAFTLMLSLALMFEYSGYLFVTKVENASNCTLLTEKDLSEMPLLRKALEVAKESGRSRMEIGMNDVKALSRFYGSCVIYRGEKYRVDVLTT